MCSFCSVFFVCCVQGSVRGPCEYLSHCGAPHEVQYIVVTLAPLDVYMLAIVTRSYYSTIILYDLFMVHFILCVRQKSFYRISLRAW